MQIFFREQMIKVDKNCAKLAYLNHCAVPFLSQACANLRWSSDLAHLCSIQDVMLSEG